MSLFCKHQWRTLDKHVEPSDLDKMLMAGLHPNRWSSLDLISTTTVICCCDKCGKIKKYRVA